MLCVSLPQWGGLSSLSLPYEFKWLLVILAHPYAITSVGDAHSIEQSISCNTFTLLHYPHHYEISPHGALFYTCLFGYSKMDAAEIEAKLRLKPRRRKRNILEFTRQFGWCVTLAFKVATIQEHEKIVHHVDRAIDMFELTKRLVIRDHGGGSHIEMDTEKPQQISTWEDWFDEYQWEMAQGVLYEDCKEALTEIEAAVRHFQRISDTVRNWSNDYDRLARRIASFETL